MSALEFRFQEVLDEITALAKVAVRFIAPASRGVLPQLHTTLESIRDAISERPIDWGIATNFPLITATSPGSYQHGDKGRHNVFAEVTSKWTIRRIKPEGKKSIRAERFALAGTASTKVRLHETAAEGGSDTELAMWRMEIGDAASPGCHFHAQVLGEVAEAPFPKSLDIPRLPMIIVTPMAVVEYILGELFQSQWLEHVALRSPDLQRWAPIQRRRFTAILNWHRDLVARTSGSPWSALKSARPATDLFVATTQ